MFVYQRLFDILIIQSTPNKYMQSISNINLQVYQGQVSGKQPKLLSQDHKKLLKGFNSTESEFYVEINKYHISHPFAAFQNHIPKYYGTFQLQYQPDIKIVQHDQKNTKAWLDHLASRYKKRNENNKFIMLQNLTFLYQLPNIFDFKIGGRNVEGKKHKITQSVSKYFLKLNGCKLNFITDSVKSVFISKYYLNAITQLSQIIQYISLFFFNGEKMLIESVKLIRQQLVDLILSLKALRGFRFISTSICIIYDAANPLKTTLKLLDFGRVIHNSSSFIDQQAIQGLQNIQSFLREVIELGQSNVKKMKEMQEHYLSTDIVIVPEKKKIKYGDNCDSSPNRL